MPLSPLRLYPDNKVREANMEHNWVLSAPDGPHLATWTLQSGYSPRHTLPISILSMTWG